MRQVFVTSRSIYYVSDNVCTKVVGRGPQKHASEHPATGALLTGGFVRATFRFEPAPVRQPIAGEHLCFATDEGTVVSSTVERVFAIHDGGPPHETFIGFEDDDEDTGIASTSH